MTNAESTPNYESSEYFDEGFLALECLEMAHDALMDEDQETYREDVWSITWEELQKPADGYLDSSEIIQRQDAINEIYALYMKEVLLAYPQLQGITSPEEMMIAMAMIPGLPPCQGTFTSSEYVAENGNQRRITLVEAQMGDRPAIMATVMDCDADDGMAYKIGLDGDGALGIGTGSIEVRDTAEIDMFEAVHPSQASNLQVLLDGTAQPFEVESKLMEIRVYSEGHTDPDALEEILAKAQAQYERHMRDFEREMEIDTGDLPVDEIHAVHRILSERSQQLYS